MKPLINFYQWLIFSNACASKFLAWFKICWVWKKKKKLKSCIERWWSI